MMAATQLITSNGCDPLVGSKSSTGDPPIFSSRFFLHRTEPLFFPGNPFTIGRKFSNLAATMDYQHDIFISYKREAHWTSWTRDHFRGLLSSYLQQDLQKAPDIFVDERIEVGQDWIAELGGHLATSKVMVAIFSGDYFTSPWCLQELDLMLERQLGCSKNSPGLIIPVIVHDGDHIPQAAKRVQPARLEKYRIACIHRDTPDYHDFSKAVRDFAPHVARAIHAAPKFKSSWIDHHRTRFEDVFRSAEAGKPYQPQNFNIGPKPQRRPPRLGI